MNKPLPWLHNGQDPAQAENYQQKTATLAVNEDRFQPLPFRLGNSLKNTLLLKKVGRGIQSCE